MSLVSSKSVNFGTNRTGLTTVGYRLINPDGSLKQARTTSGIAELVAGTGLYGGSLSFEDTWYGFIVWDTGQATPLYASENFDYRSLAGGSSSGGSSGGGGILVTSSEPAWTLKEKEKLFQKLELILKAIKRFSLDPILNKVTESQESFLGIKDVLQETNLKIAEKTLNENLNEAHLIQLKDDLERLAEAMEALIVLGEFGQLIQEVRNVASETN